MEAIRRTQQTLVRSCVLTVTLQILLGNGVGSVELDLGINSPAVITGQTSAGGRSMQRFTRRRRRISALMSASPFFRFSPGPSNSASDGVVSIFSFVRLADALSTPAGLSRPPIRGVMSSWAQERAAATSRLFGDTHGSVDVVGGFTQCASSAASSVSCNSTASLAETEGSAALVSAQVIYAFKCIPCTPGHSSLHLQATAFAVKEAGMSFGGGPPPQRSPALTRRLKDLDTFQHPWAARVTISQVRLGLPALQSFRLELFFCPPQYLIEATREELQRGGVDVSSDGLNPFATSTDAAVLPRRSQLFDADLSEIDARASGGSLPVGAPSQSPLNFFGVGSTAGGSSSALPPTLAHALSVASLSDMPLQV